MGTITEDGAVLSGLLVGIVAGFGALMEFHVDLHEQDVEANGSHNWDQRAALSNPVSQRSKACPLIQMKGSLSCI